MKKLIAVLVIFFVLAGSVAFAAEEENLTIEKELKKNVAIFEIIAGATVITTFIVIVVATTPKVEEPAADAEQPTDLEE